LVFYAVGVRGKKGNVNRNTTRREKADGGGKYDWRRGMRGGEGETGMGGGKNGGEERRIWVEERNCPLFSLLSMDRGSRRPDRNVGRVLEILGKGEGKKADDTNFFGVARRGLHFEFSPRGRETLAGNVFGDKKTSKLLRRRRKKKVRCFA